MTVLLAYIAKSAYTFARFPFTFYSFIFASQLNFQQWHVAQQKNRFLQ